jgi:hypothetical protein
MILTNKWFYNVMSYMYITYIYIYIYIFCSNYKKNKICYTPSSSKSKKYLLTKKKFKKNLFFRFIKQLIYLVYIYCGKCEMS